LANITRYTVEVLKSGETLYFTRSPTGVTYRDLENASTTDDFAELGRWRDYVENDITNGSVTSLNLVEVELKATAAPGLDAEIHDAIEAEALSKLSQLEREILGL